jgi:beta-glucosidase-like glycosyl hydrolase
VKLAPLLIPALRWDAVHGFGYLEDSIDEALDLGVGGFIIRGGPRDAVARLVAGLHERTRVPLLVAADAERGAGEQFGDCIGLPPLGALAALDDPAAVRRAARVTARELRQMGINWALAPVCDLDVAPGSAIVGARSAGADPEEVGRVVAEWIDACQAEGVLACAKHFPGHGRATGDSHRMRPSVRARAGQLWHEDLLPFRAALDAGVGSIMTAHVAYPALDASGDAATLSTPLLTELLRREMGFDGLIASDALDMDGLLAGGTESDAAVRAVAAGCDVLLSPADVTGVARALEVATQQGVLDPGRAQDALDRRDRWALWAKPSGARETTLDDVMWARQVADRTVGVLHGAMPGIGDAVELVEVDDDRGGPWHVPSREFLAATLRALHVDVETVAAPTPHTRVPVIVAAYADTIAWKGVAGFSDDAAARAARAVALARTAGREVIVVAFSHPRHAARFADVPNVACAWGGDRAMQEAAARALVRR